MREQDFRTVRAQRISERPRVNVARLERDADARWMWDLASAAGAILVLLVSISLALASF